MRFTKIFYIAFFEFVSCFVYGLLLTPDQQVEELKRAIESRDFQVITLTRPCGNNYPLLLREINILFKDIQSMLNNQPFQKEKYKSLIKQFDNKIRNLTKQGDAAKVTGFYKMVRQQIKVDNEKTFAKQMKKTINSDKKGEIVKLDENKFSILVFQEGFFSKTHALDNDYVKIIVEFCKEITRRNKKLIIVANFLHEFSQKDILPYLKNYDYPQYIKDIWNNHKPISSNNRLSNYSLVFYSGLEIALYRKGIYAEENDELIRQGYEYEFGDFKVKKLLQNIASSHIENVNKAISILKQVENCKAEESINKIMEAKNCFKNIPDKIDPRINQAKSELESEKTHEEKAQLAIKHIEAWLKDHIAFSSMYDSLFSDVNPLIRIFICADLNLPTMQLFDVIRNNNTFLQSKLYIIQSNIFRLSSTQLPTYCAEGMNLLIPKGQTIIHADPYYGPFVGYKYFPWRFWKNKEIKAFVPRDTKVKNVGAQTQSLSGNNYPYFDLDSKERIHTGAASRRFSFTGNEYMINEWQLNNSDTVITLYNWL